MNTARVKSQDCAVIVVDMQNDYCHAEGALGRRGADLSRVPAIVPNLQALIDAAHDLGAPVFFIRTEHGPWTDGAAWLERGGALGMPLQKLPICAPDTWGADYYGVRPTVGDRGVIKHRYSAFLDTDLPVLLRARGVRTLIVGGVATNICVESTVRDAFQRDFWVVTVADGCAATSVAEHEAALVTLGRHFGEVARADDILAAWGREPQAVRAGSPRLAQPRKG